MRILGSLLLTLILAVPSYAKDHSFDPVALMARVRLSLVSIEFPVWETNQTHVCAGFVVDAARGWVMTARHCVPDTEDSIFVDGNVYSYVIAQDEQFAIVYFPPMEKPALDLRKDMPPYGEPVLAVGYGYGKLMAMPRYVAAFDGGDIGLDDQLAQGMSGGPVVDREGKVVGLNQASTLDGAIGIACGADEIRAFLKAARTGK